MIMKNKSDLFVLTLKNVCNPKIKRIRNLHYPASTIISILQFSFHLSLSFVHDIFKEWNLDLGLLVSRTVKNKYLLLRSVVFCYGSQTDQYNGLESFFNTLFIQSRSPVGKEFYSTFQSHLYLLFSILFSLNHFLSFLYY